MPDRLELIRRSVVILLLAGTFVHGQTPVTYDDHIFPQIFQPRCISCHGAGFARDGRRFDTYANAISNGADVRAKVTIQNGSMPENQAELSPTLQALIGQWITDGSLESAPPTANNDVATTPEDTDKTIDVLNNDDDISDTPLTVAVTVDPTHGTATVEQDNRITYSPDKDFHGEDSFTYRVADNDNENDTATVTVDVRPVNDTPNAVADDDGVNEDASVTINVLLNDEDLAEAPLTVTVTAGPAHGSTVVESDNRITYTPDDDYNGPDAFTYRVADVDNDSDTALVSIDVAALDDMPAAAEDAETTAEDTSITIDVLENDSGLPETPLTVTITINPTHGDVAIENDNRVTYTPDPDYHGDDTFTYRVADVDSDTDTAGVTIEITSADDLPALEDDVATTDEDEPVTIDVLFNDNGVGDAPLTVEITTRNAAQIVEIDNRITYTPMADFHGIDVFMYRVTDDDGDIDTGSVQVTVTSRDDFPVAEDDGAGMQAVGPVTIDVLQNDDGLGDAPIAVTIEEDPLKGDAVVEDDNRITYRPVPEFSGNDTFRYKITDDDGDVAIATVTVATALPFQFLLEPGWNLISMPVLTTSTVADIFGDINGIWRWDGTVFVHLEPDHVLAARSGLWVFNGGTEAILSAEFSGAPPVTAIVLDANSRNLLGPATDTLRPTENVTAEVWTFDDRFITVPVGTMLDVLRGYWIYSETGGEIDLGE